MDNSNQYCQFSNPGYNYITPYSRKAINSERQEFLNSLNLGLVDTFRGDMGVNGEDDRRGGGDSEQFNSM